MAPAQQNLTWTSVGQGAIGLLAACRLQVAAYPVELWLRQPQKLAVHFKAPDRQHHCEFSPATLPIAQVFIAVKAYALNACLAQLAPHLTTNAQLIISHNGMPDLASLQQFARYQQGIWFLSTSHAALRSAQTLQHTGQGQSILSPLNPAAAQAEQVIATAMQQALGPLTITTDIKPALWRKLAVNAAINPLTALLDCRNGQLANPAFQQQIRNIVLEVCQLATLEQISLEPEATLHHVNQVIRATAENYSSMQQDRHFGRPLELDAITGFIVNTAAKHQLAVPENQALWRALQAH